MAFVLTACLDPDSTRLAAGRSDTLVVNSRQAVPFHLRLADANGRTRSAKRAQLRLVSGEVATIADGFVKCTGVGDAEVAATHRDLTTIVIIHCRPIESFLVPRTLRLVVGGSPIPFEVGALGKKGEAIDMIAGKASVSDSQVATVVAGLIYPKSRGTAAVEVEAGDCWLAIPIEVIESNSESHALLPHQFYAESISVAAGEMRNWRLPPGRYDISLFDDKGAPEFLKLASHEMNCAPLPRTTEQYSCIARDGASVVVHHTRSAGRGPEARAALLVQRKSDHDSTSARRHLAAYGCPLTIRSMSSSRAGAR